MQFFFVNKGKLIAQSPVSLSEAFKLSNELQINLTQHQCSSTSCVDVLHGWLDGSGSKKHSDSHQFDYQVTPTRQAFWVLACSASAGLIVLIQSHPRGGSKNRTTSKTDLHMILGEGLQRSFIITKGSILDVAEFPDY